MEPYNQADHDQAANDGCLVILVAMLVLFATAVLLTLLGW